MALGKFLNLFVIWFPYLTNEIIFIHLRNALSWYVLTLEWWLACTVLIARLGIHGFLSNNQITR